MKNKQQTIRLWSPLFPKLNRKNKLGYFASSKTLLDSDQLLPYQEEIMTAIERERFPGEGERGLTVYLQDEILLEKVYSIVPSVEEWDDDLFGVIEIQLLADLEPCEMEDLIEEITSQLAEGWGEGMAQHPITIPEGDIYLSFWDSSDAFFLKTEEQMTPEFPEDVD